MRLSGEQEILPRQADSTSYGPIEDDPSGTN